MDRASFSLKGSRCEANSILRYNKHQLAGCPRHAQQKSRRSLVNYDEYEHLQDTLDVLSDPILMKQIARSKSFYARGRIDWTERASGIFRPIEPSSQD